MKKFIKNNIFGFILGILLTGTTGVLAYNYVASQINYTTSKNPNIKNVEEALNDLKDKQDDIVKPIAIKNIYVESYSASYSSYISFGLAQFARLYKYF